ncbi:MAG TPA: phosphoribosylglycinamide formyltransferase [Euzebyales bacterium]|nr:phosphoribosylglycinamide formyltransferase [Euzebyales bacterium]
MHSQRIVVLASGSGTNLQALLDAPDLGGDVVGVVSDRPGARALERAAARGVHIATVPLDGDRVAWEATLTDRVAGMRPDLVVLAGFMRVLSGAFVHRWPVINIHPSLLPAFPGAHAVEDALAWGVKVTGVTVHFVDELVDHGPIIAQEAVAVHPGDTAASLHERLRKIEHQLLPDVVRDWCAGRLIRAGRHVRTQP